MLLPNRLSRLSHGVVTVRIAHPLCRNIAACSPQHTFFRQDPRFSPFPALLLLWITSANSLQDRLGAFRKSRRNRRLQNIATMSWKGFQRTIVRVRCIWEQLEEKWLTDLSVDSANNAAEVQHGTVIVWNPARVENNHVFAG